MQSTEHLHLSANAKTLYWCLCKRDNINNAFYLKWNWIPIHSDGSWDVSSSNLFADSSAADTPGVGGCIPHLISTITLLRQCKQWKGEESRTAKWILMVPTLHQRERGHRVCLCVFEAQSWLSDGERLLKNSHLWWTVSTRLCYVHLRYTQMCCRAVQETAFKITVIKSMITSVLWDPSCAEPNIARHTACLQWLWWAGSSQCYTQFLMLEGCEPSGNRDTGTVSIRRSYIRDSASTLTWHRYECTTNVEFRKSDTASDNEDMLLR